MKGIRGNFQVPTMNKDEGLILLKTVIFLPQLISAMH